MTPVQPEEEARRDECVRIVEQIAQAHGDNRFDVDHQAKADGSDDDLMRRIIAAARKPGPWPVRQRWINMGGEGELIFDWETAWVLKVTLPDGPVYSLSHEEGDLLEGFWDFASHDQRKALVEAWARENGLALVNIRLSDAPDRPQTTPNIPPYSGVPSVMEGGWGS